MCSCAWHLDNPAQENATLVGEQGKQLDIYGSNSWLSTEFYDKPPSPFLLSFLRNSGKTGFNKCTNKFCSFFQISYVWWANSAYKRERVFLDGLSSFNKICMPTISTHHSGQGCIQGAQDKSRQILFFTLKINQLNF